MLKEAAKEQEKMHTTQMTELRKEMQQLIRTQTEVLAQQSAATTRLLQSLQTQMTSLQAVLAPRAAGLTCAQAKAAVCIQARAAGFSCKDAREAGFSCKDAREAGMLWTCKDAKAAGFTCKDAKEAGFTCKDAWEAGFTCKEAREAGMLSTCKDAKEAGFTCKDARDAGFTCKDAKEAGFKPKECMQAGFTYEEGRAAGLSSRIYIRDSKFDVCPDLWYGSRKSPSKNSNPGCPLPPRPPPPGEHRRGGHTVPPRVRPAHSKSFVLTTLPSPVCVVKFDWDGFAI
jgi:ribosomal protein L13E